MDWMGLYLVAMGIGLIVVVAVIGWASIMRMTGRRSRFDGMVETLFRAQGARVYPPSLRGDPVPPVIEEVEDLRAVRNVRETPTE